MNQPSTPPTLPCLTRAHRARLLKIWQSGGWPHRDSIDLDLLAASLVSQSWSHDARETLMPTAEGMQWLALQRQSMQRAASAHDLLAAKVARTLMTSGRVVWRELSLRARVEGASTAAAAPTMGLPAAQAAAPASPALWLESELESGEDTRRPGAWRLARPDVFSVRNTTVPAYLHPVVHEVKVSRADLLSDLRNDAKREAYRWLCCESYYVFPEGIASADEIPEGFGVVVLKGAIESGSLELLRAARHSSCTLPFGVWMAMAQATPLRADPEDNGQSELKPISEV